MTDTKSRMATERKKEHGKREKHKQEQRESEGKKGQECGQAAKAAYHRSTLAYFS